MQFGISGADFIVEDFDSLSLLIIIKTYLRDKTSRVCINLSCSLRLLRSLLSRQSAHNFHWNALQVHYFYQIMYVVTRARLNASLGRNFQMMRHLLIYCLVSPGVYALCLTSKKSRKLGFCMNDLKFDNGLFLLL